jgi:hypothetical protein
MMDQCLIVLYLHKKGLSPKEIHEDLVPTLGPDAKAYRTVARYVHDAKCTLLKVTSPPDRISHQPDESDQAILLALEEQPFSSVRELSRATHLSRMTVYHRLTGPLNFRVRHLRWVHHFLSDAQKAIRVANFQPLLKTLQDQQDRAWHDVVTLDKSWF